MSNVVVLYSSYSAVDIDKWMGDAILTDKVRSTLS
jgi:hypothetical protein